jgi:hypothetical protein
MVRITIALTLAESEQLSKEGLCFAYWDHQEASQEPQALTPSIVVGNSRKANPHSD